MIKGIVSENVKQESKYPYVGKHKTGTTVLFIGFRKGFFISGNDTDVYRKDEFREDWIEQDFEKINCTVEFN